MPEKEKVAGRKEKEERREGEGRSWRERLDVAADLAETVN